MVDYRRDFPSEAWTWRKAPLADSTGQRRISHKARFRSKFTLFQG
jgi:hypothetical protein